MSIEQLRERLVYWTARLRIQDWEIRLEMATSRALNGDLGHTQFLKAGYRREARIRICQHDQIESTDDTCFSEERDHDMERTLVHELLHVRLVDWEPDTDPGENLAHCFIDEMATLLVALDRKGVK